MSFLSYNKRENKAKSTHMYLTITQKLFKNTQKIKLKCSNQKRSIHPPN